MPFLLTISVHRDHALFPPANKKTILKTSLENKFHKKTIFFGNKICNQDPMVSKNYITWFKIRSITYKSFEHIDEEGVWLPRISISIFKCFLEIPSDGRGPSKCCTSHIIDQLITSATHSHILMLSSHSSISTTCVQ